MWTSSGFDALFVWVYSIDSSKMTGKSPEVLNLNRLFLVSRTQPVHQQLTGFFLDIGWEQEQEKLKENKEPNQDLGLSALDTN